MSSDNWSGPCRPPAPGPHGAGPSAAGGSSSRGVSSSRGGHSSRGGPSSRGQYGPRPAPPLNWPRFTGGRPPFQFPPFPARGKPGRGRPPKRKPFPFPQWRPERPEWQPGNEAIRPSSGVQFNMDFTSDTMWNQAGGAAMSNNTQVWPRPLAPRPPPPPPPPQNRPHQSPVDAPFYRRENEAPAPKQSKKKGGKSKGKGKQSPAGKVSPVGKAQGHGRPQREAARQNVAVKALMSKKFKVSPGKAAKNATAAKTAALLKTAASKIAKKAKEVPVKSAEQVAEEIRLRAMKNTANKIKTLLKKSKPTTSVAGTSSGSAWLSAPEHESAAAASGPRVSRNLMGEMEFSSTDWQAIGSGGLTDPKGAPDPRAEDSDASQDDAVEIIEQETEQPEVISIADEDDTADDDVDEDDEENDGDVQVEEAGTTASNATQPGEEMVVSSDSQDPSESDIHLEGDGVSASSQCVEPNAGSERATLDEFDAADITLRRRRGERRLRLTDASGPAAVSPAVLAVLAGDESDSSAAAPSPVQLPRLEESPTGRPVVSSPLVGARSEADLQACVDFQPVVRIKRQPGLDDAVMSGSGSGRSSRSGTPPVSASSRPPTPRVASRQPESSVVAGDWFASLIPDPVRKQPVETPPVRRPKKTRAKLGASLSSKSRAKPGASKSSKPGAQIAKKSTTKSSALPSKSSVSPTEQSVPSTKQPVPSTKASVSATKPNVVATIPAVLRIRPSSVSNKAPVISLSTSVPTIRPLVPSVRPSVPSASSIRPSAIRPSVRPSAPSARSSVSSAPSSASIGAGPRSVLAGEKDPVVFVLPRTQDAAPAQGRKRRVSDTHTSPGEEWRFAAPSKRVRSSSECSVLGEAPSGRPQAPAPPGEAGSLVRRLMKMGKESLRTAVDDPSLLRSRRIMSELMRAYRGQQTRRMEQERFSAVAGGGGSPARRGSDDSLSAEVLSDLSQMLATEEGSSRPPLASPPPSGLLSAARLGLGPRTVAPKPGPSRAAGPGGSGTSPASGGGGRGRVAQSVAEAFARRASQIQRPSSSSPRREDSSGGARSQGPAGSARGASSSAAEPDIVELPTTPAVSGRARFAALDGSAARPGSAVCSSAQDRPRSPPRVVVSAAASGAVRGKAPLTAGEVFSGPPPPLGRSLRPNLSGAGRGGGGGGGGGRKPWECRSCFAQSWVNTCRIFRRNVTLIDKDVGRVADELSGREPDWENLLRMSLVENTLLAQVEEMEEQVIVLQGEMRRLRQMCRHLRDVRIRCMSYGSDVRPEDLRLPPEVQQLLRRMAGHAPGAATSSAPAGPSREERGERREERRDDREEDGGRSEDRDARASQSTQQSSPHGEPRDQGGGGDTTAASAAAASAYAADAGTSFLPGGVRIKQDPDAVPAVPADHNVTQNASNAASNATQDANHDAPDGTRDATSLPASMSNAVKPDPVSVAAAWAAMHVDEDEVSLARAIVRVRNESELNEMAAAFLSAQPPEEDDSRAGQQTPPPQFGEIHQNEDLPQALRQTVRQDSQDSQNSVDPENTPGMAYLGHIDSSSEMYKALLALAQHNGNRVMLHVAPDPCPAPGDEGQTLGEGEMQYGGEMEVDEGEDDEQRINVAEMAAVKMESGDEEEEMGESVETAREGAPETAEAAETGDERTAGTEEAIEAAAPETAGTGETDPVSMETGEKSSGGSEQVQNGTEHAPTNEPEEAGEKEKRNNDESAGGSESMQKATENTNNEGENGNKQSADTLHNQNTTGESSLNSSVELPVKKSKKKKKKKKHKHDHHQSEHHHQQQEKQQHQQQEGSHVSDLRPPSAVGIGLGSNGSRSGADTPHRRRSFSERTAEDSRRSALAAGTGRAGRRRTVSERGEQVRWQLEPAPPPCRVRSVPTAPSPAAAGSEVSKDRGGESSTPTAVLAKDASARDAANAKEDDAVAIRTQLDDLGVPIVSVQLHGPCVFVLTTDMVVHRYTLPASFVHSMCTLQVVCDSTPLWSEPSSLPRPRPTCMVVKQTGQRVCVIVGDDTGALTLLQQVKEGVSPTRGGGGGGGSGDAGEERPTLRRVQVGSAVRSLAIKAARLYIGGDAFFAVLNVERLLALETLPEEDGRPLPVRFWRSGSSGSGGGGALLRWHALDADVACVKPARAGDEDAVVLSLRGRPLQIRDGVDGELLASVGPRAADQGCHLTTRWGHALYTLRPPTAAGDTSAASATTCCFTAVHLDSASFAGGGWRLQQPITALDADGDHLYVGHLDGSLRMMLCDQKASGASGLRLRSVRQLHGASSSPLQAVAARADKVVTGSSSGRVEMFVLHAS